MKLSCHKLKHEKNGVKELLNEFVGYIATMLGCHKRWVCRRIALVERLSREVLDHIRLELINPTIGRELSKLPRSNQPALLRTVPEHRLTTRQTANLVWRLQKEAQRHYAAIWVLFVRKFHQARLLLPSCYQKYLFACLNLLRYD